MITIMDMNDAIITGTAPSNPTNGTLWIDSSQNPNVLKQWNGTAWVTQSLSLANLDSGANTTLTNNNTTLSNMANDAMVTQQERISIKDEIQSMVGSVPTDTYTLPSIATITSSGVGQLYQALIAATNAGISTTNTTYTALTNAYTTLANYLNGLSPLPWNVTSTSTISINSSTWRGNWSSYYNAIYNLQQATTTAMKNYVASRGQNLVTNGTGLLGNNTNFSAFTFNGADGYSTKGSFTDATYNSTRMTDEIMPVDVSKTYRLNVWAKANPFVSGAHCYLGISEFDADGLQITSANHMYIANTLTTLSTPLNPGDTVINLTSAANWQNAAGASTQNRAIVFWNYTNASGYTWPAQTYSRNVSSSDIWADGSVDFVNNKITLRTGWTGAAYPQGTQVSNGSAGGTYKYIAAGNVNIPNTWTNYTGVIGGTDNTGNNATNNFSWGTAGVKLLFLNNRDVTGNTSWFSNLSFTVDLASQSSVDTINTTLGNMANDLVITQSERITVKDQIQELIGSVPTDTYTLPAIATIDSSNVGQLYQVRKSALNAGLPTSDTNYSNLTTQYNTLSSYLNGLSPLPWNVTSTSNITVTSTWRTNWTNYYNAVYQLQQATANQLQGNINGVQVGGRNYLKNTSNLQSLTNWSMNIGSACVGSIGIYTDPVYQNVVQATLTTNATSGSNWWVIQNTGLTLPSGKFISGNTYTLSFMIQNAIPLTVNFMDGNGTNSVSTNYAVPVNATWTKVTWTFKATATGNAPELYIAKSDNTSTGIVYLTNVMLEDGNRPSGWQPAPEDTTNQITTTTNTANSAYNQSTESGITSTLQTSSTFNSWLNAKANSSDLSNYATTGYADQSQSNAQSYTDGQIKGLNVGQYATTQNLTDTSTALTTSFTMAGGVNMISNSVGFSGTNYWTPTGTTSGIVVQGSPDLAQIGTNSGWALSGTTLDQNVDVTPSYPYTVSVYVKKGSTGSGYLKVYETGQSQVVNFTSGTAYNNYTKFSIDITPATSTITVELYGDSSGTTYFTAVMMNIGSNPLTWSMAPGESYNGVVNIDINGIQVEQTDPITKKVTGYTMMTPTTFGGYSDQNGDGVIDTSSGSNDEVFRMDKDTFHMKSATIGGSCKIVSVSGTYNGIAFIPSS